MPVQMTTAPRQKPSSTPAAVDTMLDGTGRTTSSASKPKMDDDASQVAVSPRVIRAANALNSVSNRKKGTRTRPMSTTQMIAQRMCGSVSNPITSVEAAPRCVRRCRIGAEHRRHHVRIGSGGRQVMRDCAISYQRCDGPAGHRVRRRPADAGAGCGSGTGRPGFEMRTYTANEGKLPNLQARFRDHTLGFFKKYDMTSIGYWVPADGPTSQTTLVYILAHPSREAAKANWGKVQCRSRMAESRRGITGRRHDPGQVAGIGLPQRHGLLADQVEPPTGQIATDIRTGIRVIRTGIWLAVRGFPIPDP